MIATFTAKKYYAYNKDRKSNSFIKLNLNTEILALKRMLFKNKSRQTLKLSDFFTIFESVKLFIDEECS